MPPQAEDPQVAQPEEFDEEEEDDYSVEDDDEYGEEGSDDEEYDEEEDEEEGDEAEGQGGVDNKEMLRQFYMDPNGLDDDDDGEYQDEASAGGKDVPATTNGAAASAPAVTAETEVEPPKDAAKETQAEPTHEAAVGEKRKAEDAGVADGEGGAGEQVPAATEEEPDAKKTKTA